MGKQTNEEKDIELPKGTCFYIRSRQNCKDMMQSGKNQENLTKDVTRQNT